MNFAISLNQKNLPQPRSRNAETENLIAAIKNQDIQTGTAINPFGTLGALLFTSPDNQKTSVSANDKNVSTVA